MSSSDLSVPLLEDATERGGSPAPRSEEPQWQMVQRPAESATPGSGESSPWVPCPWRGSSASSSPDLEGQQTPAEHFLASGSGEGSSPPMDVYIRTHPADNRHPQHGHRTTEADGSAQQPAISREQRAAATGEIVRKSGVTLAGSRPCFFVAGAVMMALLIASPVWKIKSLQKKSVATEAESNARRDEVVALEKVVDDLNATLSERSNESIASTEEIRELQAELRTRSKEPIASTEEIRELQAELRTRRNTSATSKEKINELQAERRDESAASEEKIHDLEAELHKRSNESIASTEEIQKLQAELGARKRCFGFVVAAFAVVALLLLLCCWNDQITSLKTQLADRSEEAILRRAAKAEAKVTTCTLGGEDKDFVLATVKEAFGTCRTFLDVRDEIKKKVEEHFGGTWSLVLTGPAGNYDVQAGRTKLNAAVADVHFLVWRSS